MATTLIETDDFISTRFFGGTARGTMVMETDKTTGVDTLRPATETEKRL